MIITTTDGLKQQQPLAEWTSFSSSSTSKINPRRSGHTSFTINQKPFVFGGYTEVDDENDDDKKREVMNDLWEYVSTIGWIRFPTTKGDTPGPRLVSASGVIGDDEAFLFGGWDPQTAGTGGIILDDVHRFSYSKKQWTKLPLSFPDGPTSRHVAVSLKKDNTILVHNHRCMDHVYLFDGKTFHTQPTTTGSSSSSPGSVGLHAACLSSDNYNVVVFGGAAQDGTMSNQCHVLNTKTWEWKLINVVEDNSNNSIPCPRAGACLVSCSSNNDKVVLFGGAEATPSGLEPKNDVWILDLKEEKWTKLECLGKPPPPRNAATLTPLPTSSSSSSNEGCRHEEFLLTGGWAPFQETWDDAFVLNIHTTTMDE